MKHTKKNIQEAFEAKVIRKGEEQCWGWKGTKIYDGTGRIMINYKKSLASEIAWELYCSVLPKGHGVFQTCGNTECTNPFHLYTKPIDHEYVLRERFENNFIRAGEDECWIWTGSKTHGGYGQMSVDGKTEIASRIAWRLYKEKTLPKNREVCHKCNTPACVNPAHHFLGTHKQNMEDAVKKGRMKKS